MPPPGAPGFPHQGMQGPPPGQPPRGPPPPSAMGGKYYSQGVPLLVTQVGYIVKSITRRSKGVYDSEDISLKYAPIHIPRSYLLSKISIYRIQLGPEIV